MLVSRMELENLVLVRNDESVSVRRNATGALSSAAERLTRFGVPSVARSLASRHALGWTPELKNTTTGAKLVNRPSCMKSARTARLRSDGVAEHRVFPVHLRLIARTDHPRGAELHILVTQDTFENARAADRTHGRICFCKPGPKQRGECAEVAACFLPERGHG